MARKLIITGAAGMVGQNLIPLLVERGDEVVALDRNPGNLKLLERRVPGVETHTVDLAQPGDQPGDRPPGGARGWPRGWPRGWQSLFAGADAVIDLKAQITASTEEPHRRNNVVAAQHVIDACRAHAVPHLIYFSSSVVISVADDFYTRTKRAGEKAVRESGLPHTVLRPPLLYGRFDVKHLGLIRGLMRRLPALPLPGDGRYMRQPLFVEDLCRVILAVLEREPSGAIYNVIGHERIPFIELLEQVASLSGYRCALIPVPLPLYRLALRVAALVTRKPPFTREQLDALTAGDDFPVEGWSEELGVRYTPFSEAAPRVFGEPAGDWADMISSQ